MKCDELETERKKREAPSIRVHMPEKISPKLL